MVQPSSVPKITHLADFAYFDNFLALRSPLHALTTYTRALPRKLKAIENALDSVKLSRKLIVRTECKHTENEQF